jgi:hypothetical protein
MYWTIVYDASVAAGRNHLPWIKNKTKCKRAYDVIKYRKEQNLVEQFIISSKRNSKEKKVIVRYDKTNNCYKLEQNMRKEEMC